MGYFGHGEKVLSSAASLCVQGTGKHPYNNALSFPASVQKWEKNR